MSGEMHRAAVFPCIFPAWSVRTYELNATDRNI